MKLEFDPRADLAHARQHPFEFFIAEHETGRAEEKNLWAHLARHCAAGVFAPLLVACYAKQIRHLFACVIKLIFETLEISWRGRGVFHVRQPPFGGPLEISAR